MLKQERAESNNDCNVTIYSGDDTDQSNNDCNITINSGDDTGDDTDQEDVHQYDAVVEPDLLVIHFLLRTLFLFTECHRFINRS